MIICCAGCEKPILDKFLLTVLDRTWHADCVRCSDCGCALTDKCFSREGKLFCRGDFFRRFGTKCSGCLQGISPQDLVRKARDRVFHLKCFTCCVCRKQLSTGEELYVIDENKFICKQDYMKGKAIAEGFVGALSDEEEDEDVKPPPPFEANNNGSPSPHLGMHLPPGTSPSGIAASPPGSLPPSTVGYLSRSPSQPPLQGVVTTPTSTTPTPLHEPPLGDHKIPMAAVNTGLSDTPPSEKDGGGFHDSETSDTEGNPDSKGDVGKLPEDEKGNKRRGPRTTIKAKQLEVLKSAFATTPKPTRHIREQLAKETGLPMRVIQVWFQNKRSKERRMKQLTSMGMRAHLFANPRKLRGMRMSPSMEDAYPYYGDAFGYGPQGFHEFFPGQGPPHPHGMGFPHGVPPAMEQPLPPGGPMSEFPSLGLAAPPPVSDASHFMTQQPELLSQRASPDGMIMAHGGQ